MWYLAKIGDLGTAVPSRLRRYHVLHHSCNILHVSTSNVLHMYRPIVHALVNHTDGTCGTCVHVVPVPYTVTIHDIYIHVPGYLYRFFSFSFSTPSQPHFQQPTLE